MVRKGERRGRTGAGGGIAGRAGDFARRVIVKLSSIYFTNLHITSAVVAASQRRVQKDGRGWVQRETSVLGDVRTYVRTYLPTYLPTYVSTCTGSAERAGGWLCVLLPSRKGLQETTDFVAPATSDVRRPHEVVNTDGDL